MAPKLPPPANTKAVFAGPAWSDTDKVLFAPAVDALTKSYATFGCVYSNGKRGCAIKIGCEDHPGALAVCSVRRYDRHSGMVRRTRPGIWKLSTWDSGFALTRPRNDGWKRKDLPFDERFLDHKMTR